MQPKRWTFLDYVDGNGVNRISDWLQILPFEARVKFESLLGPVNTKGNL